MVRVRSIPMRLPWLLASLMVVGLPLAQAQPVTPAARPVPAPVADIAAVTRLAPVPLLWKASNGERSVYLLGAFHLLRPDDYPLSADVDAAFADAESLLLEMAPAEMESPSLALRMSKAALRKDGTLLDRQLPAATAAKLRAWLAANGSKMQAAGLSPQLMQLFEPWFVALTVSVAGMTDDGLDPGLGLDRYFANAATAAGKPVAGFETGDEQIALFDGMAADEQLQLLDDALTQSQPGNKEIDDLHSAWRDGDTDRLWGKMAADMQRDYPKLYRRVNVQRNDAWLPEIESRLRGGGDDDQGEDTLVVVGALHLLGSDGLVEKLRARGYRVERICSACVVPRTGTSTMQSTGHAGMHSSQPVQSGSITVCMCLLPPMIASTGQAWMHLVQPMQSGSMTTATCAGLCAPRLRSNGSGGQSSTFASALAPASPPGGQRSIPASPRAIASAYGRHPG